MLGQLSTPIPSSPFYVALSGGVDSMCLAYWLLQGRKSFKAIYVHHNTPQADEFQSVVERFCEAHQLELIVHRIIDEKPEGVSSEEFWRNQRYGFFHQYDAPVLTAHHLQDVAETWIWSCLHGEGKIIPLTNKNVWRPFLMVKKDDLYQYAAAHQIAFCEDKSNQDVKYTRNRIRQHLLPEALKVNPGLMKVMAKKVREMSKKNKDMLTEKLQKNTPSR